MPSFHCKKFSKIALTAICAGMALFAAPAFAALPSIVPECALKQGTEPPTLNCALQVFGNIALIILGVTGSLALLMFVYGGFRLLLGGGVAGEVEKGKTILRNAVIGILIVMTSGLLIQYGLSKLAPGQKILGAVCEGGGRYMMVPGQAEPQCVRECGAPLTGFRCIKPDAGAACVPGLCSKPGEECCRQ